MKSLLTATYLLSFSIACFAESISVKGIVLDKETNDPIPYAHVKVGDVINVSNIEGEFIISTPAQDQKTNILYHSWGTMSTMN